MTTSTLSRLAGLAAVVAFSVLTVQSRPAAAQAAAPASKSGIDLTAINSKINPCQDFYQYSCGNWQATHPIPADQSRWGSFGELAEHNREVLHQILETASTKPANDPVAREVGDFYAACMNEAQINTLGATPLQPTLDRIAALKSKDELAATLAHLHMDGVTALFRFGSGPDAKDANSIIANADQGGLGLPSLDYYLKTDPKTTAIRNQYVAHVAKMFTLLGEPAAQAGSDAQTVLRIETALAKVSLTPVERRDPTKTYNKMSLAQFKSLAPDFNWTTYFAAVQAPAFATITVGAPGFFRGLNAELASASLADWKTYLRWHVVHDAAPALSAPFVDANFDFFSKTINGTPQNTPRWNRCVATTDRSLGEALGQLYVKVAFGPNAKVQILTLVHELETAMAKDINTLDWMSEATKQQALVKLKAITNKIAYPDKWRDYSSVAVKRADFYGNTTRVAAFNWKRSMDRLGKPAIRTDFGMTPPTVNASYSPQRNDITFPAGILQPPFFGANRDVAVNFGGIGVVIGHEMTHGFDDEGSQYDATGNLHDWWTDADSKAFKARTQCIVDQYSRYSPVDGVQLNGELTLGENGADNAGTHIAFLAMENALTVKTRATVDGYTPEQRFFLGFAQVWCENVRPATARALAKTDPHSPGKFRVEGVVTDMPEFAKAFHCGPNDPMTATAKSCRVW